MAAGITPTELRKNLYQLLDRVIETGEPLRVDRKGATLVIQSLGPPRVRFGDGPRLHVTDLSVDELAAVSWEDAWSRDPP